MAAIILTPYKLTYYYLGKGAWLNNVQRNDSLISDCRIQKVYFRHPELEKIEFELTYWRIDNRMDIQASTPPSNSKLHFLYNNSISAYPAKLNSENVLAFELQQLTFDYPYRLIPITLEKLNETLKINLKDYFTESRMIAFGKVHHLTVSDKKINSNSDVVIFESYHDGKFIDAFKASILAPILYDLEEKKI